MLITRTPLRISLGGGGTDLPSYYGRFGGSVVAAAIDKYVYVGINRTFRNDYFLKYAELERVERVEAIRHPILREVLTAHQVGPAVEIVSLADIPGGTGLGSSGTFTVGLLRAVYAFNHDQPLLADLAEEACQIEIERLARAVGKQDQYIAAFGGIKSMRFAEDGAVEVAPLAISTETIEDLEDHLLLFFTGYARDAAAILTEQKERSEGDDAAMLQGLHVTKRIGEEIRQALERGDTTSFGELMNEHWQRKRRRSQGMSHERINGWYELALRNGAIGGKLVGAGGGGFLMFYASDPAALRQAMAAAELPELRFRFDHEGSCVIVRN